MIALWARSSFAGTRRGFGGDGIGAPSRVGGGGGSAEGPASGGVGSGEEEGRAPMRAARSTTSSCPLGVPLFFFLSSLATLTLAGAAGTTRWQSLSLPAQAPPRLSLS